MTAKGRLVPYDLGYSSFPKNRSATKAQQEAYARYEEEQEACLLRARKWLAEHAT